MNIVDKPRLYRELRRLLKPSGLFAMHEILAGPNHVANQVTNLEARRIEIVMAVLERER